MAGHFFQKRQEPTTTRIERKKRALEKLIWLLLLLGSAGKSSSHDRYGPAAAHSSPSVPPAPLGGENQKGKGQPADVNRRRLLLPAARTSRPAPTGGRVYLCSLKAQTHAHGTET